MTHHERLSQALANIEALTDRLIERVGPALFTNYRHAPPPLPVITIHLREGGPVPCAWFCPARWIDGSGATRPELSFSADLLPEDTERVAASVLHELVHYANWLDGARDADQRSYHNHRFKDRCDRIGLVCEHTGTEYGWAATRLSPALKAVVGAMPIGPRLSRLVRLSPDTRDAKREESAAVGARNDLTLILTEAPCLEMVRVATKAGGVADPAVHYLSRADEPDPLRWHLGFAEVEVRVTADHIECRVRPAVPASAARRAA